MKEYKFTFTYAVKVKAEDKDEASSIAWRMFGDANPDNADTFLCEVHEVSVWDTDEDGDYTCVDCGDAVSEDEVLGHRKFGEPRCEGCYDKHKYGA